MGSVDDPGKWNKTLAPDRQAGDLFGSAVSQSGNLLAIGARKADPDGQADAGVAYLYRMEANGSTTFLDKALAPTGQAGDELGASVSMSGNLLAVGAVTPGAPNYTGATYLFRAEANGSVSFLDEAVYPNPQANAQFGHALSLSGNLLAIGAPSFNVDDKWGAGASFLYRVEANGTATFLQRVTAPDANSSDSFGCSLSLHGNQLLVGANGATANGKAAAGAVYLYELESNGSVTFVQKLIAPNGQAHDVFGFGNSVSHSDNLFFIGASGTTVQGQDMAGTAYQYRLEANGTATFLREISAPLATPWEFFGISLAQSDEFLAVGASKKSYLYRIETNGSLAFVQKFISPEATGPFGNKLSLSGNRLTIGVEGAEGNTTSIPVGAAYTFDIYEFRHFAPLNDANFQNAINLWFSNEANATAIYGHIKDWNVSAVTECPVFKDRLHL